MPRVLIEAAVDSLPDATAAINAGADRLELCAALSTGGLTPPADLYPRVNAVAPGRWVVFVRLHAAHFHADDETLAIMERAIGNARDAGATGAVFGCLTADRRLDHAAHARLIRACGEMTAVLHRAFDLCSDWRTALDQAADAGFGRILTSGGVSLRAPAALDRLAAMADFARGRLELLPGGGLRHDNAAAAVRAARARAVHTSGRDPAGRFNPEALLALRRALGG
ncbi:MAG: copper homeostasis protein CutC [Phycisphaerae bacterium]|nr:MAG: copper homeostasis protein CutC [Phycisphaerae bacterium]